MMTAYPPLWRPDNNDRISSTTFSFGSDRISSTTKSWQRWQYIYTAEPTQWSQNIAHFWGIVMMTEHSPLPSRYNDIEYSPLLSRYNDHRISSSTVSWQWAQNILHCWSPDIDDRISFTAESCYWWQNVFHFWIMTKTVYSQLPSPEKNDKISFPADSWQSWQNILNHEV